VVRPVARYRPGARRGGPQLEPVYFVTQLFPGSESVRIVQVYTGSQEKVAEFAPWELSPPALASDEDPGFVDAAVDYVLNVRGAPSVYDAFVLDTQWFGERINQTLRVAEQVIDGKLYCTLLRTSRFAASYSVPYVLVHVQPESFPELYSEVTSSNSVNPFASSASYDLLTVSVDLATGSIEHSTSALYTSSLTNIAVAADGAGYKYTRNGTYTGYKEAISASLPSSHPFKACGQSAWSYLSNLHSGSLGSYSYTTPDFSVGGVVTSTPRFISFGVLDGAHSASPDFFNRSRQPFAAISKLNGMAGVNLTTGQRVLRNGSVHELSTLDPTWLTCQGFSLLGASVPGSFASYTSSDVEPLEDLLDVSGLLAEDQAGIIEAATPPNPPLSLNAFENVSGFPTTDPTYFVSNSYRPLVAGSPLIRFYSTHYLISD
jgi:hypothetical protein